MKPNAAKGIEKVAETSNHSAEVDLMAPGDGILGAVPPKGYTLVYGTSHAAPQVAGAIAILKQAKPGVNTATLTTALTCSGKEVVRGGVHKPRIDVRQALDAAVSPATRTWDFLAPNEANDFSPLRGTWAVNGGSYMQTDPAVHGPVASGVANCDESFDVSATLTRSGDPATGIVVQATVDYKKLEVSGYWLAYGNNGAASLWRFDSSGYLSDSGKAISLCDWTLGFPVNVNGTNIVRAVSVDGKLLYQLNGKTVCKVANRKYRSGRIMPTAFLLAGNAFMLDKLTVQSLHSTFSHLEPQSSAEPPPMTGALNRLGGPFWPPVRGQ